MFNKNMKLKMVLIVCISLIAIMSIGAISASEDIANDAVAATEPADEAISQTVDEIEPADEPIVQQADDESAVQEVDDESAVQVADDEANVADGEENPTNEDEFQPEYILPYLRGDTMDDAYTYSVGEKFRLGINATEGVEGEFRVYYAGVNDFGLFKWNDTVLASSKIVDGIGFVELSFPQAGGLYDLWDYTSLWIEYNTTKGNGHLELWYLEIIENPKTTNASVSPLVFVEGGNNSVNIRFSSEVGGFLDIFLDEELNTKANLEETVPGKKYDYSTTIDYLTVGTHAIRLFFEQYSDYYENEYGPDLFKYSKTFYVTVKKWEPTIIQTATNIASSPVTLTYNTANGKVTFTLKDANNNIISGEKLSITFNGKTYSNLVTNSKGQVSLAVSSKLVPKTYKAICKFAGDESYKASSKTVNVVVKKATPKITAKAKTFKKSVKTKKYTITLKTNQNKVMKNTKVTLKVNKKTYTAKTNSKGQATFKITKLTKKGKYTAVVKYGGNSYYAAKTVKPKITVK